VVVPLAGLGFALRLVGLVGFVGLVLIDHRRMGAVVSHPRHKVILVPKLTGITGPSAWSTAVVPDVQTGNGRHRPPVPANETEPDLADLVSWCVFFAALLLLVQFYLAELDRVGVYVLDQSAALRSPYGAFDTH
jgi:hypothetical protein